MDSSIYFKIGIIMLSCAINILELLEEKYPEKYKHEK